MARRDTSPRPVLRPEGFGVAEQTERMLQPEGDLVTPTEVLKTGITEEVMDKAQEYVDNPPPPTQQSPVQKAIDKSLIGGAEEDYEVKVSKVTPEGRGAIRGMISRVLGKEFDGDLDAFYYCTTFVSDMLDSIGADPLNPGAKPESEARYGRVRADAYMKYGTPVDIEDIQEGDIVIFDFPKLPDGTLTLDPTRGKRNGRGDHATFYAGDRLDVNKPGSNYIGVLGGEQGGGAAISMKSFDKSHILGVRRIQYNDIDYEFTKELAKVNPDFNKFLNNEAQAFDFNAFMEQSSDPIQGTNRLTSGFDEGGLTEAKGLSWGELIVDNILGLDNEYESFGEKLGKAINEDEIKFLKDAAVGVYEGTKEFVQAPVETTKQVVNEIKDSVTRLGSEDLNIRLQRMYNVSYEQATDEQVNQAREAVLGDALTALELVPAAKVTTTVAGAAIPSGLKADVVGQTKAMLSGDREFLSATPTNRATTQSLSAGFTGQNPPTYIPKDESVFDPDGIYETKDGIVKFREPIAEFTRKLTMTNSFPSKGMTGAEFLRLLEKDSESIPPSSYKEGLVDRDKRYTREELLDAVTKSPKGLPESLYYTLADLGASPAFGGYQRQSQVGFTGYPRYPEDTSYFSIPILSRTSGNTFKANSQHFDASTTAHVRGSFIDPMVGFNVDKTLSPEFKSIVGKDRPYLLVEEIQSDLLQKGYRKPKNSFDVAFDRATSETMTGSPVTFQEAYGDITNELKSLVKSLESKGVAMPEEPVRLQLPFKTGVLNHPQYKDRRKRDFIDELYSPERGTVEDSRLVEFEEIKDYIDKQGVNSSHIHQILNDLREGANRTRSINDFEGVSFVGPNNKVYDSIIVKSQDPLSNNPMYVVDVDSPAYDEFLEDFDGYAKQFGLNYDDLADAYDEELGKYYDVIDKEITDRKLDKDAVDGAFVNGLYERFLEIKKDQRLLGDETNTALPPVRKNKQTVEEALKLLIAKADQEGVDKIVIPPASKIAEARRRTIDPSDKGDRFYRTYVTDLDKALKDLEKNYPVTIHRDIELPYKNEKNQPTRTAAQQHLIDMGFEDMVNDNPNAVAANAADDAAIDDDDLFTVEEGNQFFDLPEGFFDDVPDQNAPVQQPKTKTEPVNRKGIIIDISKLREQFQVDKPRQFAEGGTVDMNQQMSFAFEDGGLRDDGMMRDPVSGNEVPPGSTAKEVRDDIPAQLSEGEYVVPADVVRYYGVKFFEDLRDNAKMGLQDMESRGRIGGEPVPAGGPMNEGDLSPEEMAAIQEMMGMAEGGVVNMYKQQQDLYSPPNPAIGNPTTGMASGGEVRGYNSSSVVTTPQQQAEQGFYAAGQQAQNAAFTGFPLGSTIFQSETAVEPVPEEETTSVTLYGPNYLTDSSQVVMLTLPADQARYDQLIAQGYTTEMPVAITSSNDNGGPPPKPPGESKPAYEDWLNSADFNSQAGIEKFIAGIEYDPSKSNLDMQTLSATMLAGPMAGLATAAGGALRGGGLQAISDLRAASLIAKAQGLDKLAGKIDTQVADIIKDGPGILDFLDDIFATGKQKGNAWAKKNGFENIDKAIEAGVTPKPPVATKPTLEQTAAKKAVSEYEGLKKPSGGGDDDPFPTVVTDKSIAETKAIMDKQTSDTIKDTTKNLERTTAKVKDIQSGKNTSGQVGFDKGGLMAKGKKKKK